MTGILLKESKRVKKEKLLTLLKIRFLECLLLNSNATMCFFFKKVSIKNSTFTYFIYNVEGESSKITSHLECLTRHTTNTSNTQRIKQKHEKKKISSYKDIKRSIQGVIHQSLLQISSALETCKQPLPANLSHDLEVSRLFAT